MIRRYALIASITLCAAFAQTSVVAQTTPQVPGITIVIPLNAVGPSREASVKAMKEIGAVVRKQPGLISAVLMEHKNPTNKPSHVDVMQWRDMKAWEAVFSNPEFQKILAANTALVQVQDGAGVYAPVK